MALLPLGVSVIVCDIRETCKAGSGLGPLESETYLSALSQYAVLSDGKEVELQPDIRELLYKVVVPQEVGSEAGIADVSCLVHEEVTPSQVGM